MTRIRRYVELLVIFFLFAFASCNDRRKDEHVGHQHQKQPVYTCPMHAEVIRNAPGQCPKCGMDLVKKEEKAEPIREIELDALLKPTNAFVVSAIPLTTIEQRTENIELNVLGNVAYDTRQIGTIASRVSGRIEKLYIKYKYQRVQKGQKVMEVYSPELATAQQNLVFLLKNDPGNSSLISAARDRLALLGFVNQQIDEIVSTGQFLYSIPVYSNYSGFAAEFINANPLAKQMNAMGAPKQELGIREGMYLQKGQAVFSVYNADKAWVLLNFYPAQQTLVEVGDAVQVIPETSPQQGFKAKIGYIEPLFREGSKTLTARVYFDNGGLNLPIGSRVKATVFGNAKEAQWLPKEAVLSLGRNQVVFVKETGGFRARQISSGLEINNFIEVTQGLAPADSVAANAHYLVDNEAFIQTK